MLKIFNIFFRAEGANPWIVLSCLVLGGLLEAVGVGSILPLVSILFENGKTGNSPFEQWFGYLFQWLEISPTLTHLLALLLVVTTVRSLVLFGAMTYAGISSARITINLRRRLLRALFRARWSFYSAHGGGKIANSLGNDATRAGDAYLLSAATTASAMQVIAYAAVALFINWKVAIAAMIGGLLLSLASVRILRTTKRAGFKQADRTSALADETTDMILNIKPLRSMNRHAALMDNLSHILRRLKRALYTRYFAKYGLLYGNDMLIIWLLCLGGALAVKFRLVSATQLIAIGVLFFQMISYVNKLLKNMQSAVEFQGSHARLVEFISEAESARENPGGTKTPAMAADCHFRNVTFHHGDRKILDDISLTIPARKITVIQGPSGAGKTTLIDLLIGFHQPTSGSIHIGETPLAEVSLPAWRNAIGYVPQDLSLFHDTVKANITLLQPDVRDEMVDEAVGLAGASDFLLQLPHGLDTDVGELGGRLSGGQRQRISLARALVRQPDLLILDEVTSALDPVTEAEIVRNIAALRGRYTIIAITHRPAWTEIADRLYTIKAGKLQAPSINSRRKA
jgi:ATP-binding cassette subfamily C protein